MLDPSCESLMNVAKRASYREQTVVVSLNFKILKGEDPMKTFGKKMVQALTFLHELCEDPKAAVIPIDHEGEVFTSTKTIKKIKDMPAYVMTMKQYFNIPNSKAFNQVTQGNGGMIKASAKMFFSTDQKKY